MDIIVIAMCRVICGGETWVDIENIGKARLAWFKKFLKLSNGIPSHDSFGRLFSLLNAASIETRFFDCVQAVNQVRRSLLPALRSDRNSGRRLDWSGALAIRLEIRISKPPVIRRV